MRQYKVRAKTFCADSAEELDQALNEFFESFEEKGLEVGVGKMLTHKRAENQFAMTIFYSSWSDLEAADLVPVIGGDPRMGPLGPRGGH